MMYALVIVLAALAMHAVYKYQEISGAGANPLDEAKLIKSIERSTQRKMDMTGAGGDGQTAVAAAGLSVKPPSPSATKTSSEFGPDFSEEGESWVADIRFTDEENGG